MREEMTNRARSLRMRRGWHPEHGGRNRIKQRRAAFSLTRKEGGQMGAYTVRFPDLEGGSFYPKLSSFGGQGGETSVAWSLVKRRMRSEV